MSVAGPQQDEPRPDIAVVVTACDYGQFLAECLRSIDSQTRPPDQLVVVDDASMDSTPALLEELLPTLRIGDRVRMHRNSRRLGAAGSLNLALQHLVDAPLVANVDADDVVLPRYLQAMAETLEQHPAAGYAYPRIELFGEASGIYTTYPFDPARLIFEGNYIPNVGLLRRAAVLEAGGYRDLPTHVDWDLWLALLEAGHEGVLVDEVLYRWRRHSAAMSYQPLWRLLAVRAQIQWRHRRLLARYRSSGLRWTASAAARRSPWRRKQRSAELRGSAWVDRDAGSS